METIKIEQLLFGYENGHKLLASSLKCNLTQQKVLEILSDASGSGKFNEYISCFPLVLDGYYAFAKTWYADEMQRPGCVWTHVLLVRFEDIKCLQGSINLQLFFMRPQKNLTIFQTYSNSLFVRPIAKRSEIETSILYYIVYTLFYSKKKAIIEDSKYELYEPAMLEILPKLPVELLKKISVCTYSARNRYINNEVFSYQITGVGNAKKLAWDINDAILYRSKDSIEEYPLWVKYISNKLLNNEQYQIYNYCEKFGCYDREFIKDFSKLLFATNEFKERYNLESFLKLTHKLEQGLLIRNRILELLYIDDDDEIEQCFQESSIIDQLILEIQDLEGILVKNKIKKNSALINARKIYFDGDKKKIQIVFGKYLHNKLNEYGKLVVTELIKLIQPQELNRFFDMDIKICSVLVASDLRFLLCKEIWKQNKNYQLEMLNYARNQRIPMARDIIKCIVDNTVEEISEDVYEVFKDEYLNFLYEYCLNESFLKSNRVLLWSHHLAIDSVKCANLILNVSDGALIVEIMKNIDSYKMSDDKEKAAWIQAVINNMDYIEANYKYEAALFLLPIVLQYKETPTFISDFVYNEINKKLEESAMDYYDWKKMECILPTVDIQQSWDKCLRLRLAFKK